MLPIFVAVVLIFCANFNMLLQYAPFSAAVTSRQKRLLQIIYAALSAVTVTVLAGMLYFRGLMTAFAYLRYGGIVHAVVLALINILVIRGRSGNTCLCSAW